jgi:glycosyltransferase 2 family protein
MNLNSSRPPDAGDSEISVKPKRWTLLLKLAWWGFLGVALVLVLRVVWQNRELLMSAIKSARLEYLIFTLLAYLSSIAAIAGGWHIIMARMCRQPSLRINLKIYIYTLAARRIPGTVWHIAGRALFYQNLGVAKRLTSLASGIEVILSIVSGLMVGALAIFTFWKVTIATLAIFLGVEIIGLMLIHPRVLRGLLKRLRFDSSQPSITAYDIFVCLILYVLMWVFGGLMTYSMLLVLYNSLSSSDTLVVISIWAITGSISFLTFLLPSNFGITEATLSLLLSNFVPLHVAISTAIFLRIFTTLCDIILSSISFFDRSDWVKKTLRHG